MKIYRTSKKDYLRFGIDPKKVSLFKKRYKIGDKIKAKILRYIDENRAIIEVEGLKLVAYFTKSATSNQRGYIYVEVVQLSPFIQLKHIPPQDGGINLYI